jgi:hypothetical protein
LNGWASASRHVHEHLICTIKHIICADCQLPLESKAAPALTWTRTYDSARTPPHWTELVCPGQYAVFVFDAQSHVARDSEGQRFDSGDNISIALCDDLVDAIHFAADVVARHSELCCEIYDHEGKAKDPLEVVYNRAVRSKYRGLKYSRRETFWGSVVLLCGIALIAVDASRDLAWIWGYVIGMKLTLVGGAFVVRGSVGWYEHRFES